MDLRLLLATTATLLAVAAGGCGVEIGAAPEGNDCQLLDWGTDGPTELATAWVREPGDSLTEARWSPSMKVCDSNFVSSLAVADDDSIYVLGYAPISYQCDDADRSETGDCRAIQWLKRLSPEYEDHWSRSFDLENTLITAVKTTHDDGAVIAGASVDGYRTSPWLARFSKEGLPLWEMNVPGEGLLLGLAVGPGDETVAVGSLNGDDGEDLWVLKLDSDGEESWNRHLGTATNDIGMAVAVDAQGRTWIAGGSSSDGGLWLWPEVDTDGALDPPWGLDGSLVALLDADGEQLWIEEAGPPSPTYAGAYAIELLPGGDAIVGVTSDEATLARYDENGARIWQVKVGASWVRALAVSDRGDIFALSEQELFHFDSDGEQVAEPLRLWDDVNGADVRMSDALTLNNDGTPLVSGYVISGWIYHSSGY